MTETWSAIPGYEGWYEVSSLGQVRSVTRTVKTQRGQRIYQGRILKQYITLNGYAMVQMRRMGVSQKCLVHRLVLQAFVGDAPDGMECCHLNDVRADNRLANLRWDTHKANCGDMAARGRGRNQNSGRTHCRRGHEFNAENTYVTRDGQRRHCKACRPRKQAAA